MVNNRLATRQQARTAIEAIDKLVVQNEQWNDRLKQLKSQVIDLSVRWRQLDPSAEAIARAIATELHDDVRTLVDIRESIYIRVGWGASHRRARSGVVDSHIDIVVSYAARCVMMARELDQTGTPEDEIEQQIEEHVDELTIA